MKKYQLQDYARIFGQEIPVAKIKDASVRKEIILLVSSLTKPAREIQEEIDSARAKLVEGHESEIQDWLHFTEKAKNCSDDTKRKELIAKAEACTEAIRISKEFAEAVNTIIAEDAPEFPLRKVSLDSIIEALMDAGKLNPEANIASIAAEFEPLIKDSDCTKGKV